MSVTPSERFSAPTVPNMIPTESCPLTPNTAVDNLRTELGGDAHLLDYIPLTRIGFFSLKPHPAFRGYLPYGIPVATIDDESGERREVCALLSTNVQQDGLLYIGFFTLNASPRAVKQETVDNVILKGKLKDEFQQHRHSKRGLVAILQACFILENREVLDHLEFSLAFPKELRCACRRYKDDMGLNAVQTNDIPDQVTNLASRLSNPASTLDSNTASEPLDDLGKVSRLPHREALRKLSAPVSADKGSARSSRNDKDILKHASFLDHIDPPQSNTSQIGSQTTRKTATPQPQTSLPTYGYSPSFSFPSASIVSVSSHTVATEACAEPIGNSSRSVHDVAAGSVSQDLPVPTSRSSAKSLILASPAEKLDFDGYLEAHEKQEWLTSELKTINLVIKAHETESHTQLQVSRNNIDIDLHKKHVTDQASLREEHKREEAELRKKHADELKEQFESHKDEANEMKEQYAKMKFDLEQKKKDLLKQQRIRLQAKSAIKEDLDRR
ncbi:Nn.00g066040.m01.CDS01 [Neocucurbitaria sp. VM-36]